MAFLDVVVQKQEQHQEEEAFQAVVEVEQAFQAVEAVELEVLSSLVLEVEPSASDHIEVAALGTAEEVLLQKLEAVPEEVGHVASEVVAVVPGKRQVAFAQGDGSRVELHQQEGKSWEERRAAEQVVETSGAASSREQDLQHHEQGQQDQAGPEQVAQWGSHGQQHDQHQGQGQH